jgi:hypothetical protein
MFFSNERLSDFQQYDVAGFETLAQLYAAASDNKHWWLCVCVICPVLSQRYFTSLVIVIRFYLTFRLTNKI